MSKVYNNNLIKSIIATILVVVFTVTIILIPFNTVYAAEDSGVVVTDTEISYNGFTIPRLLNTSDPVYDSYYSMQTETSANFYCYFYLPSLNFVVFYCYYRSSSQTGKILSFDKSYSAKVDTSANSTTGDYGYTKYIFDLNNHALYSHTNWGYNSISFSTPGADNSNNIWGYYTSSDSSSYVRIYDPFYDSSLRNFTEAVVLYANYDINGWYEYDDSTYELPNQVLSYQYLFYRENVGYVFIDSGEKLSDVDTSLTNVNNYGSFSSALYIRWEDYFNKFIYYSYDGFSWTFLNSGDVYGTSYSTSNSVVCSVLGIPSGNSVSVWSYFQHSPNIPEDLVMTEFNSEGAIGQTIEFDSGSGEYTSGSSISDIVDSYSVNANYTPNIYLASTTFVPDLTAFETLPTDVLDQLTQVAFQIDCEHSWPNYSQMLTDLFLNDRVYFCHGSTSTGTVFNFYVTDNEPSVGDQFTCWSYLTLRTSVEASVAVFSIGAAAYHRMPHYITVEFVEAVNSPALFFEVLLESLKGINNNILTFDSNMQTGFTNLTSQVKSLFDSSELGNTYLFDIKKALSDLAAAGGPDLTGIEDKLNQIISGLGSGASELLPADNEESPLNALFIQNGTSLALLSSINDSVGDIANGLDSDSLSSIAAFIAQFRLSSNAMAAMITNISAAVGSFHSGMTLFSASASKFFDTMPYGVKILVLTGPIFIVSTGVMYGARKIFG